MNFRPNLRFAEETRIEIAPLIDVVFLLLLFFLLTTTFSSQRTLDVILPESGSSKAKESENEFLVILDAEGRLFHEDRLVEKSHLNALLVDLGGTESDTVLLIMADKRVAHGEVVEIMDMARRSGVIRVSIATLEKKSGFVSEDGHGFIDE